MGPDSSAGGFGRRRGFGRAASLLALAALVAATGCGRSGHGADTDPEKGDDAAALNSALSRELTALDAYTQGQPLLAARERSVGRRLRAQEQEYVDALNKAIRGLGGEVEAEAEELDFSRVDDQKSFLTLAYELESAALASYVDAAPRLFTAAPRTLDVSLAAGHAQHLVVLRQALGATLADSVPEAFDGGKVPPPGGADPSGGG